MIEARAGLEPAYAVLQTAT